MLPAKIKRPEKLKCFNELLQKDLYTAGCQMDEHGQALLGAIYRLAEQVDVLNKRTADKLASY